ncbi:MFS transporter [Apilactobacillus quenuiae]|uniref:MFS transporter n=1 Tax=Apilactobacillus quenuiae TaxID=2008377 RepID=UPI000D018518|nr:MFS transporter [Apilactobacillus quenuiae]
MKERISTNVLLAIIAVGVMTFSGVTVETSMNITFPTLISEFHIGLNVVQWITTIYLLVLSSVIPLSKFLKERFKTSHLFICASILFLIGLIVDAMSPAFIFLLIGRLIQGIGTGIALPLMFNIILENVPKSRLGFMMGFGSLITAAASAVGPTFGGVIVNTLGWRYIFIILVPILILAFILGLISVPKLPQSKLSNNKFDVFSFILILLTFAGLIFGISNISSKPLLNMSVILPMLIGIIALTIFIKIQNRKEEPILNVKILKNMAYSKYVIAFFINQLIILGLSFIVPNYVQIINHSSSSIAGLILLPGAVVGAIISPFSGILLDRFGAKKPILTGIGGIVVSLLYLAATSYNLSDTIFTFFYTIIMIGIGLSYGNIMTKGLDYLAADIKADGNAILTTVQQFAGAIGTVIVSTIITKITAFSGANHVIGYTFAIIFLAVLSIIQFLVVSSTK